MNIKELKSGYDRKKSWITERLARIDYMLDRSVRYDSNEIDQLNNEYRNLEKKLSEFEKIPEMVLKIDNIQRMINLKEDEIDNLSCFVNNETTIQRKYDEIAELESIQERISQEIEKILIIEDETPKKSRGR